MKKTILTPEALSAGDGFRRYTARRRLALLMLLAVTLALAVLSIGAGSSGMKPGAVVRALLGAGSPTDITIIRNIRLPRVLAAVAAGCGLALSGCVMQSVLGNPMASPTTLGVGNAAVFGANFAIIALGAGAFHSTHGSTLTVSSPYAVTLCAFVCAAGATLLILTLSCRRGFSPEVVVLSGIALGSLFTAGTTILQYFAVDTQVAAAVFWTFGDLGRASYAEDFIMLAAVAAAFVYFYLKRRDYNAMAGGEEVAASLGVRVGRTRFVSLLIASALCAVCVSFLGIIGFVGLIAPAAVKRLLGADHRYTLPASALTGASVLLISDTAARTVVSGISLPVGAVTSLLGGPVFLWLLLRRGGMKR